VFDGGEGKQKMARGVPNKSLMGVSRTGGVPKTSSMLSAMQATKPQNVQNGK
jgi:hypothetical protein